MTNLKRGQTRIFQRGKNSMLVLQDIVMHITLILYIYLRSSNARSFNCIFDNLKMIKTEIHDYND